MFKGERIKELRKKYGLTQEELGEKIGKSPQSVYRMEKNALKTISSDTLEQLAKTLNTSSDYLLDLTNLQNLELYNVVAAEDKVVQIPVYGKIPAGRPIEALEVDYGYITIDKRMLRGDKQFIGLKVTGDSMYPKYMEGDVIILEITPYVQSGDDVVAFIGYDNEATLKRFHWKEDGIELEPLNREYPRKKFGRDDLPVRILGKVREIRREV